MCELVIFEQLKTFGGMHNELLKRVSDTEAHIHFDHCADETVFRIDQIGTGI